MSLEKLKRRLVKSIRRKSTFKPKYVFTLHRSMFERKKHMSENFSKETFLGSFGAQEYFNNKLFLRRLEDSKITLIEKVSFICSSKEWNFLIRKEYETLNHNIFQFSESNGIVHFISEDSVITYTIHQNHIELELVGDRLFIDEIREMISSRFEIVNANIEWIYSTDGSSVSIPLTSDKMPFDEMYPFLSKSLTDYYDDYIKSPASILLLLGPPGTGKTTFIRGLLQHTNKSALVTYDSSLLEKDYIFSSFIENDKSIFVIEDADLFLKSRQEGNTMMHKFLNVGDGLVTTKDKKMIFSTNLPSIREIDTALVRPGRCYDIIEFRNLTQEEAKKLAKKLDVEIDVTHKNEWSIAEIFFANGKKNDFYVKKNQKVGFL